jgi:Ala-tRNA(Pro) deacylase
MAIAIALQQYLADHGVKYDLVPHAPTLSSMRTAEACHVPGDCLAKAVVVKEDGGYLLAVIPASHRLHLADLAGLLSRELELATEREFEEVFRDCARGAVPPVGAAYGLRMVVDDRIAKQPDIYFEGGDHATLVHVTGPEFARLTGGQPHGLFSLHHH